MNERGREATAHTPESARPRLPPLNALRAFEAAARHKSFTRAARELNVTQSAVSYQVKLLEERLGVKLFQRLPGGLLLTAQAEEYFSALRHAFDTIIFASERMRTASTLSRLTVSTFPQFARYWLLPRLPDFAARYPDIQIDVVTALQSLDLDRHGVDVAVRWGSGWEEFDCHLLFAATMLPVCCPAVLHGPPPIRAPADLLRIPWLDVEGSEDDWDMWFSVAGIANAQATRRLRFDSLAYAMQAAAEGLGVVMARLPLAQAELDSGRLVAPFKVTCPSRKAWYLLVPRFTQSFPKVRAFRDWMLQQVRMMRRD